jgi:tetratricopeptide (TPR) repeat protein
MSTENESKVRGQVSDAESDVWNAIAAFEQILEAIPDDRASLEALLHAYQQIGDVARATEYFLRLADVLIREEDHEAARALAKATSPAVAADPRVTEWLGQFQSVVSEDGGAVSESGGATVDASHRETVLAKRFNLADELSFAWMLMEGGVVTQEEYSGIVQDLTEMSGGQDSATVSVLHVIENRGFKNIARIMGYAAAQCGTPILSLSSFDIQSNAAALLPMDFMIKRGVLVFDLFGHTGLAVAMNPQSQELRDDVEVVAGRACHYYLALPSEFDKALERIDEMLSESRGNS